jgi:hypothetical protein
MSWMKNMVAKKKKIPALPGCLVNKQEKVWDWHAFVAPREIAAPPRARIVAEQPIANVGEGDWAERPDGRWQFHPAPRPVVQQGFDRLDDIIRAFGENAEAEPNQVLREIP